MRRKSFASIIPTLLLVFMAMLASGCSDQGPIVVGFSGPLEGKYSDLGTQGRNGVLLAFEEINARGGIGGRELKLITHDDGATSDEAALADRALIESGAKVIIGHMTSGQSIAGYPVAEAARVPMLSPTTSTPLLAAKKDLFFRTIPVATDWAVGLAKYCTEVEGIKRVVSITDMDNEAYAAPFNKAFGVQFTKGGGTPPQEIRIHSSRLESWAAVIDEVVALDAPALQVALSARDLAALARELRQREISLPIYSAMWAYTRELLLAGGKSAEGIVFAVSYTPDNTTPRFLDFQKRYFERFGWQPNFAAAFGYECALSLEAALNKAGGDVRKIAEHLAGLENIPGVMGDFSLDEYGDVRRPSFIVTIDDRKFKTIGAIQ